MSDPPATAAHRVTPREAMQMARYGEPTDTYSWDLVVDCCLAHLTARGYKIVEAEANDASDSALTGIHKDPATGGGRRD